MNNVFLKFGCVGGEVLLTPSLLRLLSSLPPLYGRTSDGDETDMKRRRDGHMTPYCLPKGYLEDSDMVEKR